MRKRYKKQKTVVILFALGIICCFSIGYAAFSQNFLVSGKGTVVEPDDGTVTPNKLIKKAVTSGDGLYEDTTEEGRYIYKGESPNNYITFNNETWRIMSLDKEENTEKYNLKIIRNESIGTMAWDIPGVRDNSTSTYCINASSSGCNAWAATVNLTNNPNEFILYSPNGNPNSDTTTFSGTVTQDSSLNTYLNETYLKTIKDDSKYIVSHDFNVGTPGYYTDTEDITTDISQEALYKWNGKIGLMTMTEILKTTTDIGCTSLSIARNDLSKSVCSNNNWMWTNGYANISLARNDSNNVRPVLYLTSDIKLLGEGTQDNPYTIVNN